MHLGESHTFQYTIDISPPKKTKAKPARKAKVKKQPKPKVTKAEPKVRKPKPGKLRERRPRAPTRTAEEQTQARRDYDKVRNQTPERKEAARLHARQVLKEKKERGQCRDCPNEAVHSQIRCEACRDKHNQSRNLGQNRKPRTPKLTPEERIEARREYERARNQTPERKEATQLSAKKRRQERVAAALC